MGFWKLTLAIAMASLLVSIFGFLIGIAILLYRDWRNEQEDENDPDS